MGDLHWLGEGWLETLNAIGVVGGLIFTAVALHSEAKTRRVSNLLTLTQNHREIWKELYNHPNLSRVLQPNPDTSKKPVTRDEEIFVNLVIQHLSSVFHAMRYDLAVEPEGLRRDIRGFFSLPIPMAIWKRVKVLQNAAFVRFLDECLDKK